MEISEIISQIKEKFGDNVDVEKIKQLISHIDYKNLSFSEIVAKIKDGGLLHALDGNGKVESAIDDLKGKASSMLGGMFGSK